MVSMPAGVSARLKIDPAKADRAAVIPGAPEARSDVFGNRRPDADDRRPAGPRACDADKAERDPVVASRHLVGQLRIATGQADSQRIACK
jgi:hypothetical protein